ncbi:hypothetical protein [Bacteroides reticulotermitis]|uniref:hypothetical protein n=1 Tax=Bacteroides reticulotermitis TaxID=1133319 RepID=UPI0005C71F4F|nr:hypothetical protein [Bacteroides reticulotermitis]
MLLLCLSACHEQEDYGEDIQDGKLVLNYQVDGGMQASTYGVAPKHMNAGLMMYILFSSAVLRILIPINMWATAVRLFLLLHQQGVFG